MIVDKGVVIRNLAWRFAERCGAQGMSFIVSLVLARMLLPEEYGIVALVLVFINLANVFVTDGLGEALIQKQYATERDFSTIFFCGLVLSLVLYGILYCMATAIGAFYKDVLLTPVLRVLSLQIPLSAVKSVQEAYVSKHMMFKKFFFSTLGGTIISGGIGIVLAYNGFGVWALVAQYLVNSVVDMIVLFFTVKWRPHLEFDCQAAKQLIGYGWKLVVAQFINSFYSELRSLLIGKVYSPAQLAAYNKGNQFPSLLILNINTSISDVLFPALAKYADDVERQKELTRTSIKMSSYLLFPMLFGLMAVSEPLVRLLLTEKWLICVPFLRMCCVYWMFQPSQTANVQAIKAVGRSDLCLKLEIVKKCIGITLLLCTIGISVNAVVLANTVFAGISALINIVPNKKLICYGFKEQLMDVLIPLLLSVFMYICAMLVLAWGMGDLLTIVLQVLIGVGVYVVGSILLKVDGFWNIVYYIKKKTN